MDILNYKITYQSNLAIKTINVKNYDNYFIINNNKTIILRQNTKKCIYICKIVVKHNIHIYDIQVLNIFYININHIYDTSNIFKSYYANNYLYLDTCRFIYVYEYDIYEIPYHKFNIDYTYKGSYMQSREYYFDYEDKSYVLANGAIYQLHNTKEENDIILKSNCSISKNTFIQYSQYYRMAQSALCIISLQKKIK